MRADADAASLTFLNSTSHLLHCVNATELPSGLVELRTSSKFLPVNEESVSMRVAASAPTRPDWLVIVNLRRECSAGRRLASTPHCHLVKARWYGNCLGGSRCRGRCVSTREGSQPWPGNRLRRIWRLGEALSEVGCGGLEYRKPCAESAQQFRRRSSLLDEVVQHLARFTIGSEDQVFGIPSQRE